MSFTGAGEKVIQGVSAGLYSCGTSIMATSQALVPVDTGTLKRSGDVEHPVVAADSVTVTVGFGYGEETNEKTGETATGYAVYVEERVWSHSRVRTSATGAEFMAVKKINHKPPTQAHFLRDATLAHEPQLSTFIEEGVRAKLAGEF